MNGPMPTVTYDGTTYKVRSRKTEIPDLDAMDRIAALMWLLRNTYPRGTSHRRPVPNIAGLNVVIRPGVGRGRLDAQQRVRER